MRRMESFLTPKEEAELAEFMDSLDFGELTEQDLRELALIGDLV